MEDEIKLKSVEHNYLLQQLKNVNFDNLEGTIVSSIEMAVCNSKTNYKFVKLENCPEDVLQLYNMFKGKKYDTVCITQCYFDEEISIEWGWNFQLEEVGFMLCLNDVYYGLFNHSVHDNNGFYGNCLNFLELYNCQNIFIKNIEKFIKKENYKLMQKVILNPSILHYCAINIYNAKNLYEYDVND
jgi:hypothetical protein